MSIYVDICIYIYLCMYIHICYTYITKYITIYIYNYIYTDRVQCNLGINFGLDGFHLTRDIGRKRKEGRKGGMKLERKE